MVPPVTLRPRAAMPWWSAIQVVRQVERREPAFGVDRIAREPVWKGQARYLDVVVDGQVNRDAAWYYPDPSRAARKIGPGRVLARREGRALRTGT